ncbi:MAG: hypothetical protein ACLR6J_15410 [Parabacteroides merdae]
MMSILIGAVNRYNGCRLLGHVGEVELGEHPRLPKNLLSGGLYAGLRVPVLDLQAMIARRNGEQSYKATGKTLLSRAVLPLSGLAVLYFAC